MLSQRREGVLLTGRRLHAAASLETLLLLEPHPGQQHDQRPTSGDWRKRIHWKDLLWTVPQQKPWNTL